METANPPVRFILGGREIALLFNWRAVRLLRERQKERGRDPSAGILDGFSNEDLAFTIWALAQNPGNGEEKDRPKLEWIEDNLDLTDIPRIEKAMSDLRPAETAGTAVTKPNGAVPGELPFVSSTSGPSPSPNSESTGTGSGTTP